MEILTHRSSELGIDLKFESTGIKIDSSRLAARQTQKFYPGKILEPHIFIPALELLPYCGRKSTKFALRYGGKSRM